MRHPIPTGERKLPEWRVSTMVYVRGSNPPVDYLLTRTMLRARAEALKVHPRATLTRRTLRALPAGDTRLFVYAEYYHIADDWPPCCCDTCTGQAPDLAGGHRTEWRYGWNKRR